MFVEGRVLRIPAQTAWKTNSSGSEIFWFFRAHHRQKKHILFLWYSNLTKNTFIYFEIFTVHISQVDVLTIKKWAQMSELLMTRLVLPRPDKMVIFHVLCMYISHEWIMLESRNFVYREILVINHSDTSYRSGDLQRSRYLGKNADFGTVRSSEICSN
jgi:hypothetical protein